MKRDKEVITAVAVLVIILIIIGTCIGMVKANFRILKAENAKLQQQLQSALQEKEIFKEGKYTLITNLSSSIYLNRIPASFDENQPWEDVNGVKFFDITVNGTHYRYVEGHIEMPQLALYAPNIHLEVVSDSKWPKEGK